METTSPNHPRFITFKILDMLDEDYLSHQTVAEAALTFLSEADVRAMARANGWFTCQNYGCDYILDEDDPVDIESGLCSECRA